MANIRAHGRLILQDENLGRSHVGTSVDGKVKSYKEAKKKGAGGLGHRKALNDITNSSRHRQETSLKKNNNLKEFDIAEEMCLHDHRKCIEEQKAAMERNRHDWFLLDHEMISPVASPKSKTSKAGVENPPSSPQLIPSPTLPKSSWLSKESPPPSPPPPIRFEPLIFDFVLKPVVNI